MKRNLAIIILIFSCLLLFEQCRRHGRCLGTIKFTQEALNIIPYKTGDIISLKDSLGNIVQYHINRKSKFNNVYNGNPSQDDIDTYDYYIVEENHVYLDSETYNPTISLYIGGSFSIQKEFGIYVSAYFSNIGSFYGNCGFADGKLFEVTNSYQSNSILKAYDTLTILNKNFYSVYYLSSITPINDSSSIVASFFYTINQGIVGLRTNKGKTWCLN